MAESDHGIPPSSDDLGAVANGLIDKLSSFVSTLDVDERKVLAALLAPGIDAAWGDPAEVSGYSLDWDPGVLPSYLGEAIRGRNLRIEGVVARAERRAGGPARVSSTAARSLALARCSTTLALLGVMPRASPISVGPNPNCAASVMAVGVAS